MDYLDIACSFHLHALTICVICPSRIQITPSKYIFQNMETFIGMLFETFWFF